MQLDSLGQVQWQQRIAGGGPILASAAQCGFFRGSPLANGQVLVSGYRTQTALPHRDNSDPYVLAYGHTPPVASAGYSLSTGRDMLRLRDFSTAGLAPGAYVVRVQVGAASAVKRLVAQPKWLVRIENVETLGGRNFPAGPAFLSGAISLRKCLYRLAGTAHDRLLLAILCLVP